MNLTIDIRQLLQIENIEDTHSIKMISMTLLEKIRNILLIEEVDDKYKISIVYELYFRIKGYNHYSLQ
jgi:hypothetical protein